MLFMAFKLNSTPTKVAAYQSALEQQMKVYKLTLAGKALAMAGPNPFQSAVTPSAAINFRAQSRKPEYVPWGADCSRDLIVWSSAFVFDFPQIAISLPHYHLTTPNL